MRGQRLFVRPIDAADASAVASFLAEHAPPQRPPGIGLVGKLVGELVAVLAMEMTERAIRVDDLVVAKDLRRKRIGRVMMSELDVIARKLDREWIEVDRGRADEFLERLGFRDDGAKMVRRVK
jgi:GNAT superfamily N-acetyltransferase